MSRGIGTLALLAATLAGCGGIDRLDIEVVSTPPRPVTVQMDGIVIDEGLAVAVVARPVEDDEPMAPDTVIELSSRDEGVLVVRQGPEDFVRELDERRDGAEEDGSDSEEAEEGLLFKDWLFVLSARGEGTTFVDVSCDGEVELVLDARVTAPSP